MTNTTQDPFILASASPRRKQLLEKTGYIFKVIPSTVDESEYPVSGKTPEQLAMELAYAKAVSIAEKYPDILVLGADTIVDLDGTIIGKPANAKDAERITRELFSRPHKVITAVSFIRLKDNINITQAETTIVYPKKLTAEQITEHIKSNNWQGKAGAYGIQESGDEFVEKINGSFTNVMGLPMELVEKTLEKIPQKPQ
ncbi:MAG: septum formation protein Maf [Sedimentisphaerales bacterium]|nr:septum formation protein Maf [Sedimentisphaerales bacterium]